MEQLIPPAMRELCRLDDLQAGAARGFPARDGGFGGLFAVRLGETVHVYVNACPHIGTPLDWVPDRFLSADGTHIVCAMHGAEFRISDGVCVRGPCRGDALEPVPVQFADGMILIPNTAGS